MTVNPAAAAISAACRRSNVVEAGMAMMTCCTEYFCAKSGMICNGPNTGKPRRRRPLLAGSLLTTATAYHSPLRCNSRNRESAASPAPRTSTGCPRNLGRTVKAMLLPGAISKTTPAHHQGQQHGYMTRTERGIACRPNMTTTTMVNAEPATMAETKCCKSDKLAKRHNPRYKPKAKTVHRTAGHPDQPTVWPGAILGRQIEIEAQPESQHPRKDHRDEIVEKGSQGARIRHAARSGNEFNNRSIIDQNP
jgi:hypothetical protein